MTPDNLKATKHDLQRIAEMLVLNGSLIDCPGLVHGKTGIALFFFRYARYTGNGLYEDYAMYLIDEIQLQIHTNSPADYEKGLAGIGTGIDYLIQNRYIEVEDDIFEDFDKRMYRAVMYDPWQDFSLYDGLTGYGRYWTVRLNKPASTIQAKECLLRIVELIEAHHPNIGAKEQIDVYCFLYDLQQSGIDMPVAGLTERCMKGILQKNGRIPGINRFGDSCPGKIIRMYQYDHYFEHIPQDKIDMDLNQLSNLDFEKPSAEMGLLTGYAGEGLCRLTSLECQNRSWMGLL